MSTLKIEHIANIANSGPDVSIDTNGHLNIVNGSLQMGGTTMLDSSDTTIKNVSKIGIGTASPSALQHNYLDSGSVNLGLRLTQNNSGQGIWLEFQPGNNTDDWQVGANDVGFAIYNATDSHYDMVINNTGKIGIGESNPQTTLHLDTQTSGLPRIRLDHQNSNAEVFELGGGVDGITNSGFSLRNVTDSANVYYIDSNNHHFFNTASITQSAANPILKLETSWLSGNYGQIRLGYVAGEERSITGHYDDGIKIKVNAHTHTFDVNGRLGIGTTSPTGILDLEGSGATQYINSTSGNSNLLFQLNNATTGSIEVGGGNSVYITANNASGHLYLRTGGANTRIFVSSTGNVGIGTTGPLAQLEIDPPAVDTPIFAIRRQDNSSIPLFKFFQDSSVAQGTGHAHINTHNRDLSITADASSTKTLGIYLKTTGNVGIGTENPGAKLTITDENAGQASLQIRNFNTSATGSFDGNYNVEIRSATSTTTHGMLIHLNENNIGRRALDISDSVGAQSSNIFASFVQGKVGINNTGPLGQLDIVVPQDKVPLVIRSGGKSNIGYNAGHVMHCHNSISSSGVWYDVCYVSHSPNIFILGSTVQDGSAHLGGSRWCSRMYGTYGSVAHTTFGGGTRTVAMNGGAITGLDYRYLNGGASSGSYRLQVYVTWSGSISSMEVYTTVMGNGSDTLQEDN